MGCGSWWEKTEDEWKDAVIQYMSEVKLDASGARDRIIWRAAIRPQTPQLGEDDEEED